MKALLLLFTLSLLWGSSFLWTKQLLLYFDAYTLVFLRCAFGWLALFPFWFLVKEKAKFRITLPFIVTLSLGAAIPWTIVSIALTSLDTGVVGVLNAATPVIGILLVIWLLKEVPSRQQIVGVILGFIAVSVLLLLSGQAENTQFSLPHAFLMLLATTCYALNSILVKKLFPMITAIQLGLWTLGIAAVLNGIVSFIKQPSAILQLNELSILFPLIILGCLSSGLGYLLFYHLVISASPIFALLTTFIIPFITLILGIWILDEPLHNGIKIGLPLMISSLLIMSIRIPIGTKDTKLKKNPHKSNLSKDI